MEDLRKEELSFVEFLKETSPRQLNSALGEEIFRYGEQIDTFRGKVSAMTNSFNCNEKRVVDALCDDSGVSSSFLVLALHYVKQCALRYRPDYWDDRDKACVSACYQISQLSSFRRLYEKKCAHEYPENVYFDRRKDTSKGVALVGSLANMHSTLRQTFCNVVLTFLMSVDSGLKKEILSNQILRSERVHFFMI